MDAKWQDQVKLCRQITENSLVPAWLLPSEKLPPKDQLNVSGFIDTCGALTPRELDITKTPATELVAQMGAGTLTAVETVTAFLKRAHIGHQLLNFATEFMVDDSIAAATELDEYFKSTGKLKGPLHGLPISVKEHIGFKGRICHTGYVAWTTQVPDEDALILRLVREAGAVFHVRTNEPQSLMVSP